MPSSGGAVATGGVPAAGGAVDAGPDAAPDAARDSCDPAVQCNRFGNRVCLGIINCEGPIAASIDCSRFVTCGPGEHCEGTSILAYCTPFAGAP